MRDALGVPRTCGDEPTGQSVQRAALMCSPHTRGSEPAIALLVSRAVVRMARAGPIRQWRTTRGRMAAMPSGGDLFKGRHFDRKIFVLWVRWHLRY